MALAEVGRLEEAITTSEEAVLEAEAVANIYAIYRAYCALGAAQLIRGEPGRAIDPLRRAERIAVQADLRQMVDNAVGLLGYAHALAGRLDQALPMLEEVVLARPRREAATGLRDRLYLSDTYLRWGRLDEALGAVQQALGLARTSEQRGQEGHGLRLLGEVHAARNAGDQAEQHFREALALCTELSMRPLIAHCHYGLGTLYRRAGKQQGAQEYLGTAITMYREMGMRFCLEKAEAEQKP